MEIKRFAYGELRFMDIIWSNEPVPSGKLAELCQERLGWKRSTTYTRLKLLINQGYLKNENSIVTALVSREQVQAAESRSVVEQSFAGSLPGFLVAFLDSNPISDREAEELKALIDAHRQGKRGV